MRRFFQPAILSLMAMLLPIFTIAVQGCQCSEHEIPACAQYWRSKIVFEGLVTEISPSANEYRVYREGTSVSLAVEKIHRGSIGKSVVDVQGNGADCGIVYEKGKRYLIYVFDYNPQDNRITTSGCSRSRQVIHATEDLAYIRSLSQGFNKSSLRGRVIERYEPHKGIQIEAEGGGKKYKTVTDEEGRFAFQLTEPGKYKVRAVGPEKSDFLTYRRDSKWFKRKGRPVLEFEEEIEKGGCAYIEFNLFIERRRK